MNTTTHFHTLLRQGETSPEAALNLFDELDAVDIPFMIGRWLGSGFPTHHPLDGTLEVSGWYGKEFVSPEEVYPLLMVDANHHIFKIDPKEIMMKLSLKLPADSLRPFKPLLQMSNRLVKTEHSQARLRMMEYRNKLSATMIYDHLPIHDVFRKVDANTVLGLMDYKGLETPFFFVLKRDLDHRSPSAAADA
jgi:hypothetical protein